MAGAERIFELLDEKDVAPGPLAPEDCCPAGASGRGDRARARRLRVQAGRPGPARRDLHRAQGRARSRSSGRRAPARRRSRACSCASTSRRAGPCACSGRTCAGASRTTLRQALLGRPAGRVPLSGDGALEHRHRRRRARPREGRGGAAAGRRARALPAARRDGVGGGLDARVDERGQNFSAGERQLLAFARAIYRDAPLLVLDEATASVDSDTEARLQRALEAVIEGRTALVIAHRLSTIRAADRIVVFHKGRVVEVGTHDELIALGGVYARLYRMQYAHEQAVAAERRHAEAHAAELSS